MRDGWRFERVSWDEMILSRLDRDNQIWLALHYGVWEGLDCLSVCRCSAWGVLRIPDCTGYVKYRASSWWSAYFTETKLLTWTDERGEMKGRSM